MARVTLVSQELFCDWLVEIKREGGRRTKAAGRVTVLSMCGAHELSNVLNRSSFSRRTAVNSNRSPWRLPQNIQTTRTNTTSEAIW